MPDFTTFGAWFWTIAIFVAILEHWLTWRDMVKIGRGTELNRVLGQTARNILKFGILAAIIITLI